LINYVYLSKIFRIIDRGSRKLDTKIEEEKWVATWQNRVDRWIDESF